jgi:hypothetical protein
MAQVVECLPSMPETLDSIPSTMKNSELRDIMLTTWIFNG